MTPGKKYEYYIGIDCGVDTGYAVWSRPAQNFAEIKTIKIHQALKNVHKMANDCRVWNRSVLVRIEDARLRTWIPRQKNEKAERGRREGAGSVKRDAIVWEDFLTDLKKEYPCLDFEFVAPKNNATKMSAEYFQKVTGWMGRVSVHARDAAALVMGY